MSTVCVVGLGYIGLPVAAVLAGRGFDVAGYDIDARAVDSINSGRSHFQEPMLDLILDAAVQAKRLRAATQPTAAEFFVIAVPTPVTRKLRPDLTHVDDAIATIAPVLQRGSTVILESTVPVGKTEEIAAALQRMRPDLRIATPELPDEEIDVHLAYCPERILPGRILEELQSNDRVIGGITMASAVIASRLYQTFVTGECVLTDCRTAEFVKLIENAHRDVNIAFANELSMISDVFGVDVFAAIKLANRHPRVQILAPGPGVGGHCIAVDPWFIVDGAPDHSPLIRTAREVNKRKTRHVASEIERAAATAEKPVVACFGLAYKANVGDLRESPTVEIIQELLKVAGIRVLAVDPHVASLPPELAGHPMVELVDIDRACREADIHAFLVGHAEFAALDFSLISGKPVIDAIGLLSQTR